MWLLSLWIFIQFAVSQLWIVLTLSGWCILVNKGMRLKAHVKSPCVVFIKQLIFSEVLVHVPSQWPLINLSFSLGLYKNSLKNTLINKDSKRLLSIAAWSHSFRMRPSRILFLHIHAIAINSERKYSIQYINSRQQVLVLTIAKTTVVPLLDQPATSLFTVFPS